MMGKMGSERFSCTEREGKRVSVLSVTKAKKFNLQIFERVDLAMVSQKKWFLFIES